MKISIENFKSIKKLINFELKPMTILSGVNSSGKSSFIQLLLILKQTIERSSVNEPFLLEGELYRVKDFKEIVYNQDIKNNINVSFSFSKKEALSIENDPLKIYQNHDFYILINLSFGFISDSIIIKEFEVKVDISGDMKSPFIRFKFNGQDYLISTNDNFFGNGIWNKIQNAPVTFHSFYPSIIINNSEDDIGDIVLKFNWVKNLVNSFFINTSYIGPNRESPQYEYLPNRNLKGVSPTGNNVAQIIENFAGDEIDHFFIDEHDEKIEFNPCNSTLADAVKYWMCEVFKVADDLEAIKIGENYRINLINSSNLSTNIKHVGFGISQLLPIVVEGLRMPVNGTLIIEQPEIHLHPKLQSLLLDFLYGLITQGKRIVVETHSSHFITRMRRRIAEDEKNEMDDNINLTFIEGNLFRSLELDDFGTLNYYPNDFIEPSNKELRAIVKAQSRKRKKNAES